MKIGDANRQSINYPQNVDFIKFVQPVQNLSVQRNEPAPILTKAEYEEIVGDKQAFIENNAVRSNFDNFLRVPYGESATTDIFAAQINTRNWEKRALAFLIAKSGDSFEEYERKLFDHILNSDRRLDSSFPTLGKIKINSIRRAVKHKIQADGTINKNEFYFAIRNEQDLELLHLNNLSKRIDALKNKNGFSSSDVALYEAMTADYKNIKAHYRYLPYGDFYICTHDCPGAENSSINSGGGQ